MKNLAHKMDFRKIWAAALAVALVGTACGKKDKDDDDDDDETPATAPASTGGGGGSETGTLSLKVESVDASAALGLTGELTRSFTPVSYQLPIHSIYASTEASTATGTQSGSGETLYECASDDETECLIDLLDPKDVEAKIGAGVSIPVGTYKSIGYSLSCGTVSEATNAGGKGIHVLVKGTVEIDGTTYYTTDGAEVLTTDAALYSPATVAMGGCGGKVYNLASELAVEANQSYDVNLFLSADALAWASLDGGASNPAGCVYAGTDAAPTAGICTNLPPIAPVAGELEVQAESYVVTAESYCGKGLATFVVDSETDEALGVFLSRLYTEDGSGSACWDAGVDLMVKNPDGSYRIGSDTTASAGHPRVLFGAFERAEHSGTLSHDQSGTFVEGVAYTAIRK